MDLLSEPEKKKKEAEDYLLFFFAPSGQKSRWLPKSPLLLLLLCLGATCTVRSLTTAAPTNWRWAKVGMPTRSFPPPPVCAAAEAFRWEEEEEKFQVAKLPWPFLFPTMLDLGGRLAWAAFAAGRRRGRRWRWVFGFGGRRGCERAQKSFPPPPSRLGRRRSL